MEADTDDTGELCVVARKTIRDLDIALRNPLSPRCRSGEQVACRSFPHGNLQVFLGGGLPRRRTGHFAQPLDLRHGLTSSLRTVVTSFCEKARTKRRMSSRPSRRFLLSLRLHKLDPMGR
jgi:hypothetical protein